MEKNYSTSSLLFTLTIFSVIFLFFGNSGSVFAGNTSSFESKKQMNLLQHHIPFKGICAPGFVQLGEICVLNDRCGHGVYAGKVCIMDGKVQPYLRPYHQGHAGITVDNIICAEGKQLVFKSHDATPACVNSISIKKINERGWQTTKPLIACSTEDGKNFIEIIYDENISESLVSILYVDSKLIDCVGIAIQQCMLVKETQNSDWKFFYDQIEGFEFQPGYAYKLKVQITKIKNYPTDSSSLKYTLVEILDKNNVDNIIQTNDGVFTTSLIYTKQSPVIDQGKGYFVNEIADGVYWLIGGGYQVMFLTTGEGVIVIDAPQPLGEKYLEAIKEVTDEPITHMIYSHSHSDQTGSAGVIFQKNIEYIAHQDTANILLSQNDPNRPIPTIIFDDLYVLSVGDQTLELYYIGPFHSEGDIVIFSPRHKIAMVVDLFHPGAAPYKGFGVTVDLDEHIRAHDKLIEDFDFDVLVSGHGQILGTKEHIKIDKAFVLSVIENTKQAMKLVPNDKIVSTCVDMTIEQWEGKLQNLDQYMTEHCNAMKEYLSSTEK